MDTSGSSFLYSPIASEQVWNYLEEKSDFRPDMICVTGAEYDRLFDEEPYQLIVDPSGLLERKQYKQERNTDE